jgi:SEL1 protein
MGDYYFKGIGTNVDYEKAAACYRIAAELQLSPLAMWNLGWLYENGIGVSKDFHLAKRAYDSALNTDQDAYLPVKLSLIKMYLKYYWEWLSGGEVGGGLYRDDDKSDNGFTDSIMQRKKKNNVDNDKNSWNDMDEEMKRQYKMRKQKEREESDFFDGDSANIDNQFDEDSYSEQDELVESLLILALCIVVGWLVYVRQFRFGPQQQRQANEVPENNLPPQ